MALIPPFQVRTTLPDWPGAHDLEALLELGVGEAVRDDRRDVQPGLEHHRHLVPGLVHLAAVDALDREHVEDHRVPVDGQSSLGMPSMAILPPWHMLASMSRKRLGVARHLQAHVEALLHAQLAAARRGDRSRADVDGQRGAHALGQLEAVGVHVGDHDVARAGVPGHRRGHHADRAGAGDQHVLAEHGEGQRRVHGVAERIEDRLHVARDARGRAPRRWSSAGPGTRRTPRAGSRRRPWCPCRGAAGRPGSCGSARRRRAPRR